MGSSRAVVIAIDVGGTFTDVVLEDSDGAIRAAKQLTDESDPASAIGSALKSLLAGAAADASSIDRVVHATTLLTNTVLTRGGAKTALLATRGFPDVLAIGDELRPDLFDLFVYKAPPLVPRNRTFEVFERVRADGFVESEVDEEDCRAAAEVIKQMAVESVAVAFLNSYANPANEAATAELIRSCLPGVPVTVSAEVATEMREYPRTSTAVLNAYILPKAKDYLAGLLDGLRSLGIRAQLQLVQSDATLASLDTARRFPVRLLESGPAGGIIRATQVAREVGVEDVLAFDMGGTTAKACVVQRGSPRIVGELEIARPEGLRPGSGYPVCAPSIDLIEIGVGGGSRASLDATGRLRVGPESAGSRPGPASYGLGGVLPTVTDADLLLGLIDPESFSGGLRPSPRLAEQAIEQYVADAMGTSTIDAARRIHETANESVAAAVAVAEGQRGYVARNLPIVASGGAGPIHAYGVAKLLGASEVVIPTLPSAASALGFLSAPRAVEVSRPVRQPLRAGEACDLWRHLAELEALALNEIVRAGVSESSVIHSHAAEMRYAGQGHELRVEIPSNVAEARNADPWIRTFTRAYRASYGHAFEDHPLETVMLRVRATEPTIPAKGSVEGRAVRTSRPRVRYVALFDASVSVFDRNGIAAGYAIQGPALIRDQGTTIVVGAGAIARIDQSGHLRMQLR